MKRARTFWKALTTASQAWWSRLILYIALIVYAILHFTHTFRGWPSDVLGIVWLSWTLAVCVLIFALYRRARTQERAGTTGFNERWDRVISAATQPVAPRLLRRRRSQVNGRRV